MRIIRCSQNFGKNLFIYCTIALIHNAGSICAIANVPNLFSWLLWLSVCLYLILSLGQFIRWLFLTRLSSNIAANFLIFK